MSGWTYLALAIASEIAATSALKASDGMTRLVPAAISLTGYAIAFFCLSRSLQTIPLGVSYAIWSGVGIAVLTLIGVVFFRQTLGAADVIGTGLIVAGVLVLYMFR